MEHGREYWRQMLLAGDGTTIPRWTRDPVAGVGEHASRIPDALVASLRQVADRLSIPLSAVLLAAHAKVLSALSGECHVTTGYVAMAGRSPLLCRLTVEPSSWRALLQETCIAQAALVLHAEVPLGDLKRELGVTRPLFETVFDPAVEAHAELATGAVLQVGVAGRDELALRLRYRTDVFDAESAARFAGYHLTALASIARDPDSAHDRQSLLSDREVHYQLESLVGPQLELPDRRLHELFEDRVRSHPEAIAAVQGGTSWTYDRLNRRANQLARSLLAKGLGREGVVAVVTDRTLDWLAAVLAIFKAGGVYLPVEPHFPADRITRMLTRAGCTLVIAERDRTTTLEQAVAGRPDIQILLIDAAYAEGHAEDDLGIHVTPDQLAYIYFTSGSTGEPKGVMCEHAGMLNHMCAKIHDLGISDGQVVAQIAPQCFDISLWQLLCALLAGGQTLLIDQDTILDADRFLDTIVSGRVTVMQVVPSYLDVLLSSLAQQPRALPDLRCVSVTGEAVKKELVQRWFATQSGIALVNAYGLTETSDDTNHEVMTRVPDRVRVPLGRPIRNVHVYVVDDHLALVPLGAPGEIVFSGVCVGRGYINDAERTKRAYLADPHRAGQRLYRSGDFGRWLPDGKLEFLGRRDSQVKISGFRIEIGEIENRLLQLSGVQDAAVVVTEGSEHSRRLVAFYTGPATREAIELREELGKSLPEYMVPSAIHRRPHLPLTDNGKIDRNALAVLAGSLDADGPDTDRPSTATERWLAVQWATVLGVPKEQIGRRHSFFDLGGTSLSALKLAIVLERMVSFKALAKHPILADQAALIDTSTSVAAQS